jgi:CPA1 family monovalent cation:H+ antiporter
MKPVEAIVLLMCTVVGVVLVGRRLRLPYPVALVIGGLCVSLLPGLPPVHINPELVFLLFLPPLLYAAGWFTSWHDFKANLRPIFLLAVGLVLFTTFFVGIAVHALIPAIPLAMAFAFGAIISPPDAVAATAIAEQVRLPKRIVTVLEGESLVNDATGLVSLRFALAAAASGSFSASRAALEFTWVAAGGLALGLVVAMVFERVFRLIKDDALLITVSLLIPYIAYLPAERLHLSGVLAAVAAGIHGGWKGPELLSASTRLNATAVWGILVFLLNCVLFILIGLELPEIVGNLRDFSTSQLIGYGGLVSAVVILIRPVWVFPATWLPRLLSHRLRQRDPIPPWRHVSVVAWSGMRGVVSLAAALALPITFSNGRPVPQRGLIIFLTFSVVLSTLVFQGLSLSWLVRWLGIKERHEDKQERNARLKLAQAALGHLERGAEHKPRHERALQQVIALYQERVEALNDDVAEVLGWSDHRESWIAARHLRLECLAAERHELISLRRDRKVNEELLHQIERELDLEEARLRA